MKVLCLFLLSAIAASAYAEKTCDEDPDSGMCMAYFPKYYYDKETGTCKKFIYGGCQGNGNRYNTEEECLQNCQGAKQADVDLCSLEAETGPCRARMESYYFNSKTGKCEKFIYGGCRGNDNRFANEEACYNRCDAKKTDVDSCSLEIETGPCDAYIPSWYFNAKTGKCEEFIYGGCGGNGNRYVNEETCYSRCGAKKTDVDLCSLESETGPCRAYIPSYYFNSKTGKCEKFVYGGCGGNGNRFANEETCYNRCAQKADDVDVCSLESDGGMCRGYFPMYYFDSETNECKEFIYGGCGGNENRFSNQEECYNKCASVWKANDGCSEDADAGPCRGKFPRYFFNKESGRCEEFTYGGCRGNSNNYKTYEACVNTCGAP